MGACSGIITDSKLNSYNNTFTIQDRDVCILTNGMGTGILVMNIDKFGCILHEEPEPQKGVSSVETKSIPSKEVPNPLPIQPPATPPTKSDSGSGESGVL